MGIDGLLQLLKPITHKEHISTFSKQKIGIDISPWLYKGCYNHAMQLSRQQIETHESQVELSPCAYILQMIELLQYYQINCLFIFDGLSLPMKKQTIHKRQQIKGTIQYKLEQLSKKQISEDDRIQSARKCYASSMRVTEKMINEVLSVLKYKRQQFIIAPYESDSQLAKLKALGLIDSIITEDSDLLVYGSNAIYKLNEDGQCDYIDFSLVEESQVLPQYTFSFLKMSWEQRMSCCILAGCDYVNSIKGIGIKKAIRIISECSSLQIFIQKVKSDNNLSKKISQEYSQKLLNAKNIFKHALTYNPIKHILQSYTQPEMLDESIDFQNFSDTIGRKYPEYLNFGIFKGEYSIRTHSKRQLVHIQMPVLLAINPIKLKDLEILYTKKKKDMESLKEQKQKILQGNMIGAMNILREGHKTVICLDGKESMRMVRQEVVRILACVLRDNDFLLSL